MPMTTLVRRLPGRQVMKRVRRAVALAAACFASAVPSRAATARSAARGIIERYVAATGGRDALLADTVLHVRGRMTQGGIDGTFEEWHAGANHVLRTEHLGMLHTRSGFDGVRGWRTDFTNRKVGPLEGRDLEALRGDAWILSEQWARDTMTAIVPGPTSFLSGRMLQ